MSGYAFALLCAALVTVLVVTGIRGDTTSNSVATLVPLSLVTIVLGACWGYCMFLLEPLHMRYQSPLPDIAEAALSNVQIVEHPYTVMMKVSALRTLLVSVLALGVLLFLVALFPSLIIQLGGANGLVRIFLSVALITFLFSFWSAFMNRGGRYQNYKGYGKAYDNVCRAGVVHLNKDGVHGLLALPWSGVHTLERVTPYAVRLVLLPGYRHVAGRRSLRGHLFLAFASMEDCEKFHAVALQYVPINVTVNPNVLL